jgi:tetratricopeptide (TPR) repeat protein
MHFERPRPAADSFRILCMRVIPAFVLAFAALPAAAQQSEEAKLKTCMEKIEASPQEAYDYGLAWIGMGARPAARQCTALALIALGQEAEGAARLEQLANDKDGGSLDQRIIYLAQAGNAWLLAKMPDAAIVTLTNAVKLRPTDGELRKDRARAHVMLAKWKEAGSDLDVAIELSAGDAEALRLRAYSLYKMGRLEDAWDDVEQAMKQAPKDTPTLLLRGDIREAMRKKGLTDPAGREEANTLSPKIVGN